MLIRSKTSTILVSLALLTLPPACDDDDSGDDAADTGGKGDDGGDGADDGGGDDAPADGGGDDAPADGGADDAPADDGGDDGGAADIGETCEENADCSDICVFAGDADFGICTMRCESFSDCPDFWDCGPVGNASGDYCIPG
jgi:hypothetical protein